MLFHSFILWVFYYFIFMLAKVAKNGGNSKKSIILKPGRGESTKSEAEMTSTSVTDINQLPGLFICKSFSEISKRGKNNTPTNISC